MYKDQHHRVILSILFILAALVLIPRRRFLKILNLVRLSRVTAPWCAGQCGSNCGWNQGGACEECQANLFNNIQAGRSPHNYKTFLSVHRFAVAGHPKVILPVSGIYVLNSSLVIQYS